MCDISPEQSHRCGILAAVTPISTYLGEKKTTLDELISVTLHQVSCHGRDILAGENPQVWHCTW